MQSLQFFLKQVQSSFLQIQRIHISVQLFYVFSTQLATYVAMRHKEVQKLSYSTSKCFQDHINLPFLLNIKTQLFHRQ